MAKIRKLLNFALWQHMLKGQDIDLIFFRQQEHDELPFHLEGIVKIFCFRFSMIEKLPDPH